MKLLLDSNIFLEVLFNQPRAFEARHLLASAVHEKFISVFSLHSVGVLLMRHKRAQQWPRFLQDMVLSGRVKVIGLTVQEMADIPVTAQRVGLDFDDAYQYVTAELHNLTFVSFDKDFDHTPRGRQTPQAINQLAIPKPNATPNQP